MKFHNYKMTARKKAIMGKISSLGLADNAQDCNDMANGIMRLFYISCELNRIFQDDAKGNPKPAADYRNGRQLYYSVQDEQRAQQNAIKEAKLEKEAFQIADYLDVEIRISKDTRGNSIQLSLSSSDDDNEVHFVHWYLIDPNGI